MKCRSRSLAVYSNELTLGTGSVGSACIGSENHCEKTKSLQICYSDYLTASLSYQDVGRRRTETTHHQRVGHTVIDT